MPAEGKRPRSRPGTSDSDSAVLPLSIMVMVTTTGFHRVCFQSVCVVTASHDPGRAAAAWADRTSNPTRSCWGTLSRPMAVRATFGRLRHVPNPGL